MNRSAAQVCATGVIVRARVRDAMAGGWLLAARCSLFLRAYKQDAGEMARTLDGVWRPSLRAWPVFRSKWRPRRPFDWGREGIR